MVTGRSGADGATAMPTATRDIDSETAVVQNLPLTTGDLIVREVERKQKNATQIRVQVC